MSKTLKSWLTLGVLTLIWGSSYIKDWKYLAVVGLIGTGIPSVLFPLAQTEISSSLAGVLSTLTPIFTLILAVLFFSTKVAQRNILGVIIGLAGAMALMIFGKSRLFLLRYQRQYSQSWTPKP